ncbi:MAG: hypothetical protein FWC68_02370 [Oscillospiraceae bacterium]|nr:hypothetical protein [Oscillospiraceae bacterium]
MPKLMDSTENRAVPKEYEHVYKVLSKEPKNVNKICLELKEDVSKIASILTMLELEELVQQLPGNMFKLL